MNLYKLIYNLHHSKFKRKFEILFFIAATKAWMRRCTPTPQPEQAFFRARRLARCHSPHRYLPRACRTRNPLGQCRSLVRYRPDLIALYQPWEVSKDLFFWNFKFIYSMVAILEKFMPYLFFNPMKKGCITMRRSLYNFFHTTKFVSVFYTVLLTSY